MSLYPEKKENNPGEYPQKKAAKGPIEGHLPGLPNPFVNRIGTERFGRNGKKPTTCCEGLGFLGVSFGRLNWPRGCTIGLIESMNWPP